MLLDFVGRFCAFFGCGSCIGSFVWVMRYDQTLTFQLSRTIWVFLFCGGVRLRWFCNGMYVICHEDHTVNEEKNLNDWICWKNGIRITVFFFHLSENKWKWVMVLKLWTFVIARKFKAVYRISRSEMVLKIKQILFSSVTGPYLGQKNYNPCNYLILRFL